MVRLVRAGVVFLLLVAGPVLADTFTESFEGYLLGGFEPELKPDQDWYNYDETSDIGNNIRDDAINGAQAFRAQKEATGTLGRVNFDLELPAQLSKTTFFVEAQQGTQQSIAIESGAPRRSIAEFYVLCGTDAAPTACQFKVRWLTAESTGQELIPVSAGDTVFKVEVTYQWHSLSFCLEVDDVDDGCFPMLHQPANVQRLAIRQVRTDVSMNVMLDDWTVEGALPGTAESDAGDIGLGFINFARDIRFTSTASKFLLGAVSLVILIAAVASPLIALGRDNTVLPALGFYATLCVLWLVMLEWFPDWVGISLIIAVAAQVSMIVRRVILGIRDAGNGPALVAGSLGYFIIAATVLGMSGYAAAEVQLPTGDLEEDGETDGLNETETVKQGWGWAVLDCTIGIISAFKGGDCSRETEGKAVTWAKDTIDSIGRVTAKIFGYARAAISFLFQLLTFQLPIPIFFNAMIVLPPAAALATMAFQTIVGRI